MNQTEDPKKEKMCRLAIICFIFGAVLSLFYAIMKKRPELVAIYFIFGAVVLSFFYGITEKRRELVVIYFIFGVVLSFFYGYWAFEIHDIDKKNLWGSGISYDEKPWFWKVHQFWFNFAGSFAGWGALGYIIFIRFNCFQNISSLKPPTFIDVIIFIIAMVGITGYLPYVISQIEILLKAF